MKGPVLEKIAIQIIYKEKEPVLDCKSALTARMQPISKPLPACTNDAIRYRIHMKRLGQMQLRRCPILLAKGLMRDL
jgi:hypothetical protein